MEITYHQNKITLNLFVNQDFNSLMTVISKEEFEKATRIDKIPMPGLSSFLMELMKINEVNNKFESISHLNGLEFIDQVLEHLDVIIDFDESELDYIPTEGAFIALANHPYGGIDGLILLKLLCKKRPDTKLMANFILDKIPNLKEWLIAVNPFENIQHISSISGIKKTIRVLESGTPVGIFPAGEVSSYQAEFHKVTDKKWDSVIGKIIAKAKAPVIPIYFSGNNGLLFNILGLLHPMLRTAKLPSELFNKQGQVIKVRIGKPILIIDLPYQNDPKKLLDYFRARTYALGAGLEGHQKLFKYNNLFKITRHPRPIVNEISSDLLADEIKFLNKYLVCKEKSYEVYITPVAKIPNIIKEIGRLRELTFREVGEGTNKSIDLDKYDIYYNHLFIWDTEMKLLVGAYRIGKGDEIYYSYGKHGFYLSELFKMKKELAPVLSKSLELGRSWVRKEYQQKPLPLFLLWEGILKYLIQYPEKYHYLIGPVSISNNFSQFSKSLLVDYINKHHFDGYLASFVKPRKKFKIDFSKADGGLITESETSLKEIENLITGIETRKLKFPVLLRQYIALNAKIIGFNTDPKFSDSLDGFLVLNLKHVPSEILGKLML